MASRHENIKASLYEIEGTLSCSSGDGKRVYKERMMSEILSISSCYSDVLKSLSLEIERLKSIIPIQALEFEFEEDDTPAAILIVWLNQLVNDTEIGIPHLFNGDVGIVRAEGRSVMYQCLSLESISENINCTLADVKFCYKRIILDSISARKTSLQEDKDYLMNLATEHRVLSHMHASNLSKEYGQTVHPEDTPSAFSALWISEVADGILII